MTTTYTNRLPGLNYIAPLTLEEFRYLEEIYEGEFLQRLRLVFGSSTFGSSLSAFNRYGIISPTDPRVETNSILMPYVVAAGGAYDGMIGVTGGALITPLGQIAFYSPPADMTTAYMRAPSGVEGSVYVVLFDYQTIDAGLRLTDEQEPLYALRETRPASECIKIVPLVANSVGQESYSSYTATDLQSKVVLGVITMNNVGGYLAPTMSTRNDLYTFNRPWFSPVDFEHRAMVGAGKVTQNNPHGQAGEDFDWGAVPLFQQFKTKGVVVAKDYHAPNVPGTVKHILIHKIEEFGQQGYYNLPRLPVHLGTLVDNKGFEYSYFYDKENNRILPTPIPSWSPVEGEPNSAWPLVLTMTVADALEPTFATESASILVRPPGAWETVISEGRVVRNFPTGTQTVPLGDMGPFNQAFDVFCCGDGAVLRNPFTLVCTGRLGSSIPMNEDVPVTTSPSRPFFVRAMIRDNGAAVRVKLLLKGLDTSGNPQEEVIENVYYTPSMFPPSSVGPLNVPESLYTFKNVPPEFYNTRRLLARGMDATGGLPMYLGSKVWSKIESFNVDSNSYADSNITANTTLTILAYLDSRGTVSVASGTISPASGASQLSDERDIVYALHDSGRNEATVRALESNLVAANSGRDDYYLFLTEDVSCPKYIDPALSSLNVTKNGRQYYRSKLIPMMGGLWRYAPPQGDVTGTLFLAVPGLADDVVIRLTTRHKQSDGSYVDYSNDVLEPYLTTQGGFRLYSLSVSINSSNGVQLHAIRLEMAGTNLIGYSVYIGYNEAD